MKNDKNRKIKATFKHNQHTLLQINNPQLSDAGNYTLYADNGRMKKEQTFELLVRGISTL